MTEITVQRRNIPIGYIIFGALAAIGLGVGIYRFIFGLGAATNLSDFWPWGIWLGFDVITGVPLGAGAFAIAAIVYIFGMKKYRPIVRPALLTGFLGYLLVIMGLLADLGQPQRIWHVMLPKYWNLHSVLFEVGWCVILYTSVMFLEVLPIAFERFNWSESIPAKLIHSLLIPIVILGITLSTMHQSSLGSLFLIMADKLDPLWYSPILPVFFYVSAIAGGLAMVIIESTLSSRAFKRGLEMDILSGLGKMIPYLLGLLLLLRLGDLLISGDFVRLFSGTTRSYLFLIEQVFGVLLPLVLLSLPKIRNNPNSLFWSSVIVLLGMVYDRLVTSLVAAQGSLPNTYFPTLMEFALTIGLLSGGVLAFTLASRYLPIFPEHEAETH